MAPSRKQVFVCAAGSTVPAGTETHALPLLQFPTAMSFRNSSKAAGPPFAWMGGNRHGKVQVPPLARYVELRLWQKHELHYLLLQRQLPQQ
jgi:hypothetical protein